MLLTFLAKNLSLKLCIEILFYYQLQTMLQERGLTLNSASIFAVEHEKLPYQTEDETSFQFGPASRVPHQEEYSERGPSSTTSTYAINASTMT